MRDLALRGTDVGEAVRALTTYDVRWACDVLRPVYDRSDTVDGRVSIEVDPRISGDAARTVAEAKALWWLVDRPNLYIKIPATREGLPAITEVLAAGISVNVTLIFSLERYDAVMDAFLDGIEQAQRQRATTSRRIGSVASFFVSRVDTEIDKRLARRLPLRGKAGDRQRASWPTSTTRRSSPPTGGRRWPPRAPSRSDRCGHRPASRTRPTTTPCTSCELVAPGTVNTMPEATLDAVADHGVVTGDPVTGGYAEAAAGARRPEERGHRLRRGRGAARARGRREVRDLLGRADRVGDRAAGEGRCGRRARPVRPSRRARVRPRQVLRDRRRHRRGREPGGLARAGPRSAADRRRRAPAGRPRRHALGSGRGVGGRAAARLARRGRRLLAVRARPAASCATTLRAEGARRGRALRHGRLLARPRGDLPLRRRAAHGARLHPPGPGARGRSSATCPAPSSWSRARAARPSRPTASDARWSRP